MYFKNIIFLDSFLAFLIFNPSSLRSLILFTVVLATRKTILVTHTDDISLLLGQKLSCHALRFSKFFKAIGISWFWRGCILYLFTIQILESDSAGSNPGWHGDLLTWDSFSIQLAVEFISSHLGFRMIIPTPRHPHKFL